MSMIGQSNEFINNKLSIFSHNPILNNIMPLCLEPTSKTTVINDPTAGMNEQEIQDYISNVGGGLCGYPEVVREIVGLGINLSLLTLTILSLAYIILGAYKFSLEKNIEEKNAALENKTKTNPNPANTISNIDPESTVVGSDGKVITADGLNRYQRRLKQKLEPKKKTDD